MRLIMGQQASTTDSDGGTRLDHDPVLWCLIQGQLELSLFEYVHRLNVKVNEMREVKDFATAIKGSVEALKRTMAHAQGELLAEVQKGNVNAEKVRSMTRDLKEANKEVEAFLGESGSNFPASEPSDTQQQNTDINGVTLNKGGSNT